MSSQEWWAPHREPQDIQRDIWERLREFKTDADERGER